MRKAKRKRSAMTCNGSETGAKVDEKILKTVVDPATEDMKKNTADPIR